jgi:hypothetical protein
MVQQATYRTYVRRDALPGSQPSAGSCENGLAGSVAELLHLIYDRSFL